MERNGLDGLKDLISSLRFSSADRGWAFELFHAYKQLKAIR